MQGCMIKFKVEKMAEQREKIKKVVGIKRSSFQSVNLCLLMSHEDLIPRL